MIVLLINSIYESFSGEIGTAFPQGERCIIVRTQGCNLKCPWCDTKDTIPMERDGAVKMTPTSILSHIQMRYPSTKNVLITGGEPLIQENIVDLIRKLTYLPRYNVQVETNGTIPMPDFGHFIMDLKPMSVLKSQKLLSIVEFHVKQLRPWDVLKVIVSEERDLYNSQKMIEDTLAKVAFSVVDSDRNLLKKTIDFAQSLPFDTAINVQIHKLLDIG